MAEPIPNKRNEFVAPTPANTPSTAAPISSHAQQPGVASITEEDSLHGNHAAVSSIFAQNPNLVGMVAGRLRNLVGAPSGYLQTLSPSVQRRIAGLKGLQKQHETIEGKFQEEVLELEKKYFKIFQPLYQKRADYILGSTEPTDEEVESGKQVKDSHDDAEVEEAKPDLPVVEEPKIPIKGIPEFWLTAMKNHNSFAEIITDRDEAALKHLVDIRLEYLEKLGFKLIFHFEPNEFFTNKTISKTYYYQNEGGYGGEFIYDHADGDTIDWKEGKNLTVRIESKKQRNKTTKQTRIVKKTVNTESFFNFFSPPHSPEDEDAIGSDLEERLELDYTLGEDVKEKLIPRAVDWFTGEALNYEEMDDDDVDAAEFDEEEDDDENDSDGHGDGDDSEEDDDSGKPKSDATECKQS